MGVREKQRIILCSVGIFIFLLCPCSFGQDIKIDAVLNKKRVHIGDIVEYRIILNSRRFLNLKLQEIPRELPGLEVRERRIRRPFPLLFFLHKKYSITYVLTVFSTGTYSVGGMEIRYKERGDKEWKVLKAPEFILEVKSLLEGNPLDIKDVKEPLDAPVVLPAGGIATTGIIAILLLCIFCRFFRKKRIKPKQEEKPPSPYEIAIQRLDQIKLSGLAEQGKVKEYYIRISDCLRRYLEKRLNISAPEMTTEEFLTELKFGLVGLNDEQKKLLEEFLSHCDMVKFARYKPSASEIESTFQSAVRLIEELR